MSFCRAYTTHMTLGCCVCCSGGAFYCATCARHFISEVTQLLHVKTKAHKQQLKRVAQAPYRQADADAAAGMGALLK